VSSNQLIVKELKQVKNLLVNCNLIDLASNGKLFF